jgi:hypothetical protein
MSNMAPLGAGLPGRHAVGQSGGGGGRHDHLKLIQQPGFYDQLAASASAWPTA